MKGRVGPTREERVTHRKFNYYGHVIFRTDTISELIQSRDVVCMDSRADNAREAFRPGRRARCAPRVHSRKEMDASNVRRRPSSQLNLAAPASRGRARQQPALARGITVTVARASPFLPAPSRAALLVLRSAHPAAEHACLPIAFAVAAAVVR